MTKNTFNNMENYKIKLVYWLANQFGYEITMVKMNNTQELKQTDEIPTMSLREKTKNFLATKLNKKLNKKKKQHKKKRKLKKRRKKKNSTEKKLKNNRKKTKPKNLMIPKMKKKQKKMHLTKTQKT